MGPEIDSSLSSLSSFPQWSLFQFPVAPFLLSCRGQESGHLVRRQVHRDVGRAAAQRRRAAGRRAQTDQTQVREKGVLPLVICYITGGFHI